MVALGGTAGTLAVAGLVLVLVVVVVPAVVHPEAARTVSATITRKPVNE
jgi:hypothetical protein